MRELLLGRGAVRGLPIGEIRIIPTDTAPASSSRPLRFEQSRLRCLNVEWIAPRTAEAHKEPLSGVLEASACRHGPDHRRIRLPTRLALASPTSNPEDREARPYS